MIVIAIAATTITVIGAVQTARLVATDGFGRIPDPPGLILGVHSDQDRPSSPPRWPVFSCPGHALTSVAP